MKTTSEKPEPLTDDEASAMRMRKLPSIITLSKDLECWDFSTIPNLDGATVESILECPNETYRNADGHNPVVMRVKLSNGKKRLVKAQWTGPKQNQI